MVFEKAVDVKSVATEMVKRLNEDARRIRALEDRFGRIENRISNIEDGALTQMGDLKIGLDRISQKLIELSQRMEMITSELTRLNREVGKSASKMELKEVENFIDLINPLTSKFVTKDQLERMLRDIEKKG